MSGSGRDFQRGLLLRNLGFPVCFANVSLSSSPATAADTTINRLLAPRIIHRPNHISLPLSPHQPSHPEHSFQTHRPASTLCTAHLHSAYSDSRNVLNNSWLTECGYIKPDNPTPYGLFPFNANQTTTIHSDRLKIVVSSTLSLDCSPTRVRRRTIAYISSQIVTNNCLRQYLKAILTSRNWTAQFVRAGEPCKCGWDRSVITGRTAPAVCTGRTAVNMVTQLSVGLWVGQVVTVCAGSKWQYGLCSCASISHTADVTSTLAVRHTQSALRLFGRG